MVAKLATQLRRELGTVVGGVHIVPSVMQARKRSTGDGDPRAVSLLLSCRNKGLSHTRRVDLKNASGVVHSYISSVGPGVRSFSWCPHQTNSTFPSFAMDLCKTRKCRTRVFSVAYLHQ